MWVIMDLGADNDLCVSKIGIYNQNEYSNSKSEVTSFDLLASDSTAASSFTTLVSDAALEVSDKQDPNPERQVSVGTCIIRRYIKFVAKTVMIQNWLAVRSSTES